MFSALEHHIKHQVRAWLSKTLFRLGQAEGDVFLNQRRVFILPTHPGLGFAVTLVVLFIGSINYNLSLGFGFTFLLGACAVIDMHLTFRNLAHLHLARGKTMPVFAGEEAQFELHLMNRRRHDRYALWLDFVTDSRPDLAQAVDLPANSARSLTLSTRAQHRGWLAAPRVRLQTRFPLGLFRAWSYWQPDMQVLVYPQPESDAPPLPQAALDRSDGTGHAGEEDFAGVRGYQAGDSLKRLAWRQIAKLDPQSSHALISKEFEGGAASDIVLDYHRMPAHLDTEARLSRLTRWVIEAESRGISYGFCLGNLALPAARGPAHQQACLRALALYGAAA